MGSDDRSDPPEPCPCARDGFADLPPEIRPQPQKKSWGRQVTCPGCGLVYSTNRATDLCMKCEREGRRPGRDDGNKD
jgi:hypothetical protein